MANPPIDRRPSDSALASTIRETARAVRDLLAAPVLTALQRTPVVVTFSGAGDLQVAHGLGRIPLGYLVVGNSGAGVVISDGTFVSTADPTQVAYIHASGATTVRLLFI